MMPREFGRRARQHKVERCSVGRTVHVAVVRIRECRRMSVAVVLMFVDVVSWHCEDRCNVRLGPSFAGGAWR